MQLAALCVAGVLALAPAPPERPDKIVFTSMSADGKNVGVCVMNPDGSNRTTLTKEGAVEIDPALSPDGQRIAFVVVGKDDKKAEVWVMAADGTGRKQLTQNEAKTLAVAPAWSPDGQRILFTRMTAGGPVPSDMEMVAVGADGRDEKRLGKGVMGVWSPDGKQILYTASEKDDSFEPRLWAMDADGKNAKQLIRTTSMMGSYSPDGKRIAYMGASTVQKDGPPTIHVADADGSRAAEVTTGGGWEVGPRWSADGKRLLFSRTPDPKGQKASIVAADPDGKNEKELTKGESMDLLGGAAMFLLERNAQPAKP